VTETDPIGFTYSLLSACAFNPPQLSCLEIKSLLMKTICLLVVIPMLVFFLTGCPADSSPDHLDRSGSYLGQTAPPETPEPFAAGVVCTGMLTRDMAVTPDARALYWGVQLANFKVATILFSKQVDGRWIQPQVAPFAQNGQYRYLEPALSPDGNRLYFVSDQPDSATGKTGTNMDIWFVQRTDQGWSEPRRLPDPVNSGMMEYFPSITREGTIYFTREDTETHQGFIYRCRPRGNGYADPEKLPASVNAGRARYNAFIDPDERFMILAIWGREDSFGSTDYYIVFRDENDTWSGPVNLGGMINTAGGQEYSASISPDGRAFFFMSGRVSPELVDVERYTLPVLNQIHGHIQNGTPCIYWVDASFIDALRRSSTLKSEKH
jgi:hypothetical protein